MPFAGLDLTRVNGPGDLLWEMVDVILTETDKEEVRATPR